MVTKGLILVSGRYLILLISFGTGVLKVFRRKEPWVVTYKIKIKHLAVIMGESTKICDLLENHLNGFIFFKTTVMNQVWTVRMSKS